MHAFLVCSLIASLVLSDVIQVNSESFDPDSHLEGDRYAAECMREAKEKVNRAIRRTELRRKKYNIWSNPMDLFEFFKRPPNEESMRMARAADVFETSLNFLQEKLHHVGRKKRRVNATDVLSPETLNEMATFAGCKGNPRESTCSTTCQANKYRTINGECNNLEHVYWGASNNKLRRWLPSQYENDFSLPIGWDTSRQRNGFTLPMVRKLSNDIIHTSNRNVTDDSLYSHMLVVWGQYIDHDIDFTPQSLSSSTFQGLTNCKETCESSPPCYPIMIPDDDMRITGADCMPFFRSAGVCGTGETSGFFNQIMPREQMNGVTSFVDASTVYGSTDQLAYILRDPDPNEGLMKVNDRFDDSGREYMPFDVNNPCVQDPSDASGEQIPCFHAGDGRVSEHATLSGIHTLWLREHNRLARELKQLNPHWHGEQIYQETRKIVGSLHQVVQYREYVPKIIGTRGVEMMGAYNGYDSNTDPTVSNVFATAAFRFGHVTIAPMFRRLGEDFQEHETYKNILLHKAFFSPWRIIKEGGLDPIFRGLIGRPAKLATPRQIMHEELREKLFKLQNQIALDLASLNLQRGRDHALPLYNDWREFCNLSRVGNFSQVASDISDAEVREKLENLYGHPGNMDLWLAGLAEDLVGDSRVGPVFMCLLAKQFKLQRDGDRYFYLNEGVHTQAQRDALEEVRLANVLCANSGLNMVQRDVFRLATFPGGFVECEELPSLNLEPWRENPDVGSCGRPRDISNGRWSKCDEDTVTYMCMPGYRMDGPEEINCMQSGNFDQNPPRCVDINECEMDGMTNCEEICTNTEGSHKCACNTGKRLKSDMQTCEDVEEIFINWAAIWTGIALGVALVAVFVVLTIAIYKYMRLRDIMKPNSRYRITDSANGSIHSNPGVINAAATLDDKM